MEENYIEVKIPILDSVEEMEVVKTFNDEQLCYVCAIARAFEKSEKENNNLKQALNEIREYASSDKLLTILCKPKINSKGETHYDLIRQDILLITDKALGGSKK